MSAKTLEDIEAIPKNMLTIYDVRDYLSCDPNVFHWQAQHAPEKLGFPVIVMKSRVKIPKQAFIRFMRGELQDPSAKE